MAKVHIKTYGCQMNERDSEMVAARLVARGHVLVPTEQEAEVVLLNTCSVRDMAEQKALGKMKALAGDARRHRRPKVLGFLGCMAQSRGGELLQELDRVDLVVGTQKFHRVPDYLDDLAAGRVQRIVDVGEEAGSESEVREHLPTGLLPHPWVSAYVSIMQGCNQFCTFCIVPYTRGQERSRTIEDIVRECRERVSAGVHEVVLLGQIVTSYGRREIGALNGKSAFVQLLEAVNAVDGLDRIRFTAPHPKGYGDDLVDAYGRLERLCEHAHLPVQSGSNQILKRMHRGYTRERFIEIVRKLRQVRPDIGISTDIIVGFPGESPDDFLATCDLVEEVGFDQVYLFKYSPRRGTPAASLDGTLVPGEIEERHARLLERVNTVAASRYRACVGRTMEVLIEGPSRRNASRLEGRTRCNRIAVLEGRPDLMGRLVDLRIDRVGSFTLYGTPGGAAASARVSPL